MGNLAAHEIQRNRKRKPVRGLHAEDEHGSTVVLRIYAEIRGQVRNSVARARVGVRVWVRVGGGSSEGLVRRRRTVK
jgi:hypothetical protein